MKNSLKYEELKNMGLPLKNALEIKALPPKNSIFWLLHYPERNLQFCIIYPE